MGGLAVFQSAREWAKNEERLTTGSWSIHVPSLLLLFWNWGSGPVWVSGLIPWEQEQKPGSLPAAPTPQQNP